MSIPLYTDAVGKRLAARAIVAACLVLASVAAPLSRPAAASAPTIERVSVSSSGAQGNSFSGDQAISADGRYVAFYSQASNLAAGDTNAYGDVFLRDRVAGTTVAVSVTPTGETGNFFSTYPQISEDGRYVGFWSNATNIVPGVAPPGARPPYNSQCYVRDMSTGTTIVASVNDAGQPANAGVPYCALSGDGRHVAFYTIATNLFPLGTNPDCGGTWDEVYVRDLDAGSTRIASMNSAGAVANGCGAAYARISRTGRYVTFVSRAPNLGTGRTTVSETWLHDMEGGATELISRAADGGLSDRDSAALASVSADGRFVAFSSMATNLVTGDTNDYADIFLRDRATATTRRVSVRPDGVQADRNSNGEPMITADGRFVAFSSIATTLVVGDTNGTSDAFVWERATGALTRVSMSASGDQGSADSYGPTVSANGRLVTFSSDAGNLVPDDTNGFGDVFIRALAAPNTDPTVSTGSDLTLAPRGTMTRSGNFTDPDQGQTWTATVDFGDGGGPQPLDLGAAHTFLLQHTYMAGGTFAVVVIVADSEAGAGSASFLVRVQNTVPVVSIGFDETIKMAVQLSRGGGFTDPDVGQLWSATVDYGDGSGTQPLLLTPDKLFRLDHKYSQVGQLTVTVTVTDDAGGKGQASFVLTLVPVRSFIFVHGILGNYQDPGFPALLNGLASTATLDRQLEKFTYFQDKGLRRVDGTCREGPAFDPATLASGLPVDTSAHSLDPSYCDSQSDIGIDALLLATDVQAQHERFGGHVTIIANSMGGAITRAYLAHTSATAAGDASIVDDVYFLQGAQAGSYVTLSKTVMMAAGPLGSAAWTTISEALQLTLGFDSTRPAFRELTPRSELYQWVNPDIAHVPDDVRYQNVASDIGIIPTYSIGRLRFLSIRITVGDLVMLPGSDDPRALPLLGGEDFDPRVAGRGRPDGHEWILRTDVAFPVEAIVPIMLDPSVVPPFVNAVKNAKENHMNLGVRLGDINVDDGTGSMRPLPVVLLERMGDRAP